MDASDEMSLNTVGIKACRSERAREDKDIRRWWTQVDSGRREMAQQTEKGRVHELDFNGEETTRSNADTGGLLVVLSLGLPSALNPTVLFLKKSRAQRRSLFPEVPWEYSLVGKSTGPEARSPGFNSGF